ncbi:MAG: sodium:solute symporter, partial [Bacteroidota bacterium]
LFPLIALMHLGGIAGIVFLIGLISAAYSSADSALTSLTTSFSIDFLRLDKRPDLSEKQRVKTRQLIHVGVAFTVMIVIIIFNEINDSSVIEKLFTIAGYTYGPLLGMFTFGIFTRRKAKDPWVPLIAVLSPVFCYFLSKYSEELLFGYKFGFELLLVNGFLVFLGLMITSEKEMVE